MKKEYILLAIITVLLGTYLFFQNSDSTHYTLPQPAEIEDAKITKFEILNKGVTLVVNKESDAWVIGDEKYPADTSKVTPILDLIKKIELTALISESENYVRYELDDAGKIVVTAWDKDKIVRKFDVGKTASSYRHSFIKLDGNKNVYHAAKNFKSSIDTNEEKLLNKSVLKFKSEAAYLVNVKDAGKEYSLSKKIEEVKVDLNKDKETEAAKAPPEPESFWINPKGEKKDPAAIDAFVKSVSDIKCENFVKGTKKEDLKDPVYTVSISTDKVYTLSVFKSDDEKKVVCTSSESSFPFNLTKDKIDKVKELFTKI